MRRCETAGLAAYLVRRGDEDAGQIFLKVNRLDGTATVLSQTVGRDGARAWLRGTGAAPVPEAEADAYVKRQLQRDPDAWVVEIEDRRGLHALDEPVL